MSGLTLPTYTWRGKTYKTVTGLCRAVDKAFGSTQGISFGAEQMHVRLQDGARLVFVRRFDADHNSIIGDKEVRL